MRIRRTALAVGLFLLAFGTLWLTAFRPERMNMGDQAVTERQADALREGRVSSEEAILSGLLFAGEELPCDESSGTFYLPVDMETGEWEEGVFRAADSGVEVWLLDDPLEDDKQEAIREGRRYRLLAVTGEAWREYAVVFTGLPVMTLETDSGEEIRYDEIYGTLRFYEAQTKSDWVTESVMSGHIRGGSSRLNPKKSYKITLYKQPQTGVGELRKNHLSFLGMREDNEWLLYAMYSEDTKVRDKLSQDIWNESGALAVDTNSFYGYRMEYIEVFQNGEYRGIYGLMEPVDYKQLGLTGEDEAQPEEYLYKQKDADVYELKGSRAAQTEEDFEVLYEYLEVLESGNTAFAAEIVELADVDNALDVWLYLQAVLGMDNIERNIFYPAVWEDGRYVIRFMPWDMDYSWGNVHDFEAGNRTRFSEEILTMRIAWRLGDRLIELDVDGAREKVKARWKELRQTVYSDEWLTEHIEEYAHQVADSGAFARDEARWINGGHNDDYESLKKLVLERMEFLDEQLSDPLAYLDLEEYRE